MVGDAVINGGPGLMLIVEKLPWANTLDVTEGVEKAMDEHAPGLPGIDIDTTIFRPATFIEESIDNLTEALMIGCLLVVMLLGAFLLAGAPPLISVVTIPLSLMAAALVLYWRGIDDQHDGAGRVRDRLGAVVDDAIIDIENIVRRLRHARAMDSRVDRVGRLDASLEVRGADRLRVADRGAGAAAVFFLHGPHRRLLPAAGLLLHARGARVDAGGADHSRRRWRYICPARTRSSSAGESPIVALAPAGLRAVLTPVVRSAEAGLSPRSARS